MLHVLDASNPQWGRQQHAVDAILHDLQLDKVPRLIVFNKCDLRAPDAPTELPDAFCVSAKTGEGLGALRAALTECLK